MFRTAPPGRALPSSFSFPIDSSSRAFQRSRSASDSLIESLDSGAVNLRYVPIQLRWRSVDEAGVRNKPKQVDRGNEKFHETRDVPLTGDPHRSGFGKIPKTTRWRAPPPCPIHEGVLGVDPGRTTPGEIIDNGEDGDWKQCSDGIQPPPSSTPDHLGFDNPPPTTAPPPHFESISRFVGFFQSSESPSSPPKT
ncbi:hypothetical protein PVAP13_9NG777554 [Panicum virgatum]|uniref:Uncharacterized protein n=1 Tax=Panicum virgatum TaxID=38727 RepID=A0A8T0N4T9_PANVG|nr:hypothetical protein PVAP13_9NG777554 [Panicum virgatum]